MDAQNKNNIVCNQNELILPESESEVNSTVSKNKRNIIFIIIIIILSITLILLGAYFSNKKKSQNLTEDER